MSIREAINRRPGIVAAVAVLLLLTGVGMAIAIRSGSSPRSAGERVWFSDDDGKTWFPGDVRALPPFDHNGKPAVRAVVFRCDTHKKTFVAYLQRFTPEGQRMLREARSGNGPSSLNALQTHGVEVKSPGAATLVNANSPEGIKLRNPGCPEGDQDNVNEVIP
jgi:hypothetical protein